MSQLVGRNCAVCRRRIAAELNARFCGCGRPVHDRCAGKRAAKATPANCPGCGLPQTTGAPADDTPAPRSGRAAGFVILAGAAVVVLGGLVLLMTGGRETGDVAVGGGVLATGLAGAAWGAVRAFR